MKNYGIIIVFLLAVLSSGLAVADDRLGPSDVTDYYLEPAIAGYVQNTSNSDDENKVGVAVVGSIWYVKHKVDIGLEAMASDSTGLFLSARYPVDNQWNIAAGVGKLGYAVDTRAGDYYAKPTSIMVFSDYQTEYGKIVMRLIVSDSSKNFYSSGACVHTNAPPDNHLDSCSTYQTSTNNLRHVFMIGFQYDL